jgi:alpha-N-arabinofuranosidase
MTLRQLLAASSLATALAFSASTALAQSFVLHADQPGAKIDRNIYGQFAEHLGRGVYEGVWVGEDSKIPNTKGYRNDVVAALKELKVPLVRWPGGCFADEYHWREGIGPRDKRPVRVNTNWGGVDENNAFGTHEFMDFAEMIGAQTYVNGNVGTGTAQESADWIEYMTSDSGSTLAQERRKNGRDKPWMVDWFAVGNETWGCGGGMRPEYYSDLFRQYGSFIKTPKDRHTRKIASGANAQDYNWTEVLLSTAAKHMDGYSIHYYTLPTGKWDKKGSATQFGEDQWFSTLANTLKMEELVTKHSAIMDKYDPKKRISLLVDEWGTWYDVEPGTETGFLYQQNSLRDALVAAINLNIFHEHADRVRMSNIAQMVNVLQAMILTDKEKMVLTPTYHVYAMYRPFQDAISLPIKVTAPDYTFGGKSVPGVTASAARDAAGVVHVALVNLDPNKPVTLTAELAGLAAKSVSGQVLTAPAMNTINTFDKPSEVKPAAFKGASLAKGGLTVTLPAKSVVVLDLK